MASASSVRIASTMGGASRGALDLSSVSSGHVESAVVKSINSSIVSGSRRVIDFDCEACIARNVADVVIDSVGIAILLDIQVAITTSRILGKIVNKIILTGRYGKQIEHPLVIRESVLNRVSIGHVKHRNRAIRSCISLITCADNSRARSVSRTVVGANSSLFNCQNLNSIRCQ